MDKEYISFTLHVESAKSLIELYYSCREPDTPYDEDMGVYRVSILLKRMLAGATEEDTDEFFYCLTETIEECTERLIRLGYKPSEGYPLLIGQQGTIVFLFEE